jgi:HK97 gp10 family phage protein
VLDLKVNGLADLEVTLRELPEKLAKNVCRASLRAGAKVIAEDARRRVPVKTGKLRDSIRVTSSLKGGRPSASVKAGNRKKGVFYAHMVERGTALHRVKPKWRKALATGGSQGGPFYAGVSVSASPQPFMRPAADTMAQAALDAFSTYMRKRLNKEGWNTPDPEPETE